MANPFEAFLDEAACSHARPVRSGNHTVAGARGARITGHPLMGISAARNCPRAECAVAEVILSPDVALLESAARAFGSGADGQAFAASESSVALVATDDRAVVGWCWGHLLNRPDGTAMAYLHHIETAPTHLRQGIGLQLMRGFMAEAHTRGATKMFLTTAQANVAARALYERLGGATASRGPTVNYWFHLTRT